MVYTIVVQTQAEPLIDCCFVVRSDAAIGARAAAIGLSPDGVRAGRERLAQDLFLQLQCERPGTIFANISTWE